MQNIWQTKRTPQQLSIIRACLENLNFTYSGPKFVFLAHLRLKSHLFCNYIYGTENLARLRTDRADISSCFFLPSLAWNPPNLLTIKLALKYSQPKCYRGLPFGCWVTHALIWIKQICFVLGRFYTAQLFFPGCDSGSSVSEKASNGVRGLLRFQQHHTRASVCPQTHGGKLFINSRCGGSSAVSWILTYGCFDKDGLGFFGIVAVSCVAYRFHPEHVFHPRLQAMDCESEEE